MQSSPLAAVNSMRYTIDYAIMDQPSGSPTSSHVQPWLLISTRSSHFCHCSVYNILLQRTLVTVNSPIWLQDFFELEKPLRPHVKILDLGDRLGQMQLVSRTGLLKKRLAILCPIIHVCICKTESQRRERL